MPLLRALNLLALTQSSMSCLYVTDGDCYCQENLMNVSALLDASSDLAQVFRMYRQDRPDWLLPYAGNDTDDDGDDNADARAKYLLATSDKETFWPNRMRQKC